MTYLQFHLIFILPPTLLLAATQPQPLAGLGGRRTFLFLAAMMGIALVYTIPWDNYLVYSGIWSYGPDRVLGTIGYVPVEEYLFFLLQPLLTGLFLFRLQARAARRPTPIAPATTLPRLLGALGWGLVGLWGWWCLGFQAGRYMGLILAWAAPVLAVQWAISGHYFWQRWRLWAWATAVPTLYLWVADRLAIGLAIWTITPDTTFGLHLFGLPIEEATFFLVTNLLVVQGLMMFLPLDADAP